MIDFHEDGVTIYDNDGNEVVMWNMDEMEEGAEVALAMATAIHIFHTEGVDAVKTMIAQAK